VPLPSRVCLLALFSASFVHFALSLIAAVSSFFPLFFTLEHLALPRAAEIIMLEQNVAIYRTTNETRFFVVGSALVRLAT
jgi:hypothetical protein